MSEDLDEDLEEAAPVREKYMVCPVCEGHGTTVNPDIDAHGLTREDFDEDPDFAEDYASGVYSIQCRACSGLRVVTEHRLKELAEAVEDRRLAAREDGNFESYCVAGDWRYGA